jgi:SpoVK/Ycf46/Vps4 family AAA+-type ATPase
MRVLGSFLTWLNDCTAPVFSMVTANNIVGLPPELLRRGRFDAIFSTSLPSPSERQEVFAIHLRKRGHSLDEFTEEEIEQIVAASDRYVPAELEAAVRDALVEAFSSGEDLSAKHITKALSDMVPLSKSFASQIEQMSRWAADNATPVSLSDHQRRERAAAGKNRSRISSRRRS